MFQAPYKQDLNSNTTLVEQPMYPEDEKWELVHLR